MREVESRFFQLNRGQFLLILRDVQQKSTQETAQILGLTEGSVKTRLSRARLQMRDALAPGIDGTWATGKAEYKKVRPF